MWLSNSKEKDKKVAKFLKMSSKKFDKYMCETYPDMFVERNLPMNKTCMCWGFCINRGWYYYLDELCATLATIQKSTGIKITFNQIKEKFASGRFYCGIGFDKDSKLTTEEQKAWTEIARQTISMYEEMVGYYCEETGERIEKPISMGWTYALSKDGFLQRFPDRKKDLEKYLVCDKLQEDIREGAWRIASDEKILRDILKDINAKVKEKEKKNLRMK